MFTFSKTTGEQVSRGPFATVRFEGEHIRDGGGTPIASHLPHGWTVDGEDYLRLDITGPVSVTWEGYAGGVSTSGHFSCINGVAYIDRRILAFVDRERGDWYLLREARHCAALLLTPV